jgi:hypothetical protein
MERGWKWRWRVSVLAGLVVAVTVAASAIAVASGGGSSQFSGQALTISNILAAPVNAGPNGDGNTGARLLRIPRIGDLTVSHCTTNGFPNGDNKRLTFTNTATIPIATAGTFSPIFVGNDNAPIIAPGESGTIAFGGGTNIPSTILLTGGSGSNRRVATLTLNGRFDSTANQCDFEVQATIQYAGDAGEE